VSALVEVNELIQVPPTNGFGLDYSSDMTQSDAQGRDVLWLKP
jgi:hypothetical protein